MKYDLQLRCQQLYEEFCESYIKQLNTLRIFSRLIWIYDGIKSSPAPERKVQISKSPKEIQSQPKIKNTPRGRTGTQHCKIVYPKRVSVGTLTTAGICRSDRRLWKCEWNETGWVRAPGLFLRGGRAVIAEFLRMKYSTRFLRAD